MSLPIVCLYFYVAYSLGNSPACHKWDITPAILNPKLIKNHGNHLYELLGFLFGFDSVTTGAEKVDKR